MGTRARREREKERMREVVLETAMELFLKEGFENVSMRRIAERIEYSPAAIYLYFKNKDEILHTLHDRGFEKLYQRQLAVLSIEDPLKRLRRHGEIYVSFALENPEYYDLMFIMRGPAKKIEEKEEWDIGLRSYGFLKQNISECMDAGELPKMDLDVATFSLWSHVHGIASLIIRKRSIMLPEDQIENIVGGAMDFMMKGISREGK